MIRAATIPTAAKVPPTAPLLSKKLLFEPLPLPLSSPLTGAEEVIVLVIADPPGAVAEMTEVTTTGVTLTALVAVVSRGVYVLVGVVTAVVLLG